MTTKVAVLLYMKGWRNVRKMVAARVIRNTGKTIHQFLKRIRRYVLSSIDFFTPSSSVKGTRAHCKQGWFTILANQKVVQT